METTILSYVSHYSETNGAGDQGVRLDARPPENPRERNKLRTCPHDIVIFKAKVFDLSSLSHGGSLAGEIRDIFHPSHVVPSNCTTPSPICESFGQATNMFLQPLTYHQSVYIYIYIKFQTELRISKTKY